MFLFFTYIGLLVVITLSLRSIVAQLWFVFIGVYTSVTYAVYQFRPDLFEILNFSVKGDKTLELGIFLILSVISNYLFYLFFSNSKFLYRIPDLRLNQNPKIKLFTIFYLLYTTSLTIYFALNLGNFNWGQGSNSLDSPLFALLFRIFIPMTILLIGLVLTTDNVRNFFYKILALFGVILIVFVAIKASSRSDIIYLFIGLIVLGCSHYKTSKIRLFAGIVFGGMLILFFGQVMLIMRGSIDGGFIELLTMAFEKIISFDEATIVMLVSQDYFAPAATLIMSLEKELVFPVAAIKSNFYNFFYLTHEDTISAITTNEFDFSFLRGAGFAYIIYAEGYNMLGFMGFLYNGLICGLLMHILNPNFSGVSPQHKSVLLAILAVTILQIIRSQSGIALKLIYTLAPVYYSYCIVFGYSLRFKRLR